MRVENLRNVASEPDRYRFWPSGLAAPTPDAPVSTLLYLGLPEGRRLGLLSGRRPLAQRIYLFVDPEIPSSRKTRPLSCNMDD